MSHSYQVDQQVTLPSDPILGTDEEIVTIVSQEPFGYYVRDQAGWEGPVGFGLELLQENC